MTAASDNEAKLMAVATPILGLLTQVGSRKLDPSRTESFIAKLDRHIDQATHDLSTEGVDVGSAFSSMVTSSLDADPAESTHTIEGEWKTALESIGSYFSEVEQKWPMTTYSAMNGAGFTTRRHFSTYLQCAGYCQQFARKSGESLSHLLWYATIPIVEYYYSAIECVYQVSCMERGVAMTAQRGGEQLRRVSQWLKGRLPEFIDDDANHFRNAAAHHHWKYDLGVDAVRIEDQKWTLRLSVGDMRQRIEAIFQRALLVTLAFASPFKIMLQIFRQHGLLESLASGNSLDNEMKAVYARFDPTLRRLEDLKWSARTD